MVSEYEALYQHLTALGAAEAARERAEAALDESERRVRSLPEGIPLPYQSLDSGGRLIRVNQAWLDMLGYSRDEVIGRPFGDLIAPEQRHLLAERFPRLKASGEIHGVEYELVRKDGMHVIVTIDGTIVQDERGCCAHTHCIVQDITELARAEGVRRKSEQRFRGVIEQTFDGICLIDERGLVIEWNPAMEEMTGLRTEEVLARPVSALMARVGPEDGVTPEKQKEIEAAILEALETGYGSWIDHVHEHENRLPNGQRKVIQCAYAPIETEDGFLLLMTAHDVTEHRQTEDVLCEHVERLRALNEMAQAVLFARPLAAIGQTALDYLMQLVPCVRASIVVYDPQMQEATVRAACGIAITDAGVGDRMALDTHWVEVLQPNQVFAIADIPSFPDPPPGLQAALHAGIRSAIAVPMVASGALVGSLNLGWAEPGAFSDKEIALAREVAKLVAIAVHQTSLLEELRTSHEQLRALTRYLQEAREEERRRIARKVHDQLGQGLTALKIDLAWITRHLPQEAGAVRDRARMMSGMIDETIHTVRRLATELRPSLLDRLGLSAAIEWEAKQWSERTGTKVELVLAEIGTEIDLGVAMALFRVAQELLTNVARHADATQVRVTLEDQATAWRLVVEDNGRGIKQGRVSSPTSLGLIGARERISALGGEIVIKGIPEQGTKIRVWVPKPESKEDS